MRRRKGRGRRYSRGYKGGGGANPLGLFILLLLVIPSDMWKVILGIMAVVYLFFKLKKHFPYKNNFKTYEDKCKDTFENTFEDTCEDESQRKGSEGEELIVKELECLADNRGRILTNIYIPKSSENETTEIDIILLHPTGIYVIESKNYTGKIYGGIDTYQWAYYLNNVKYSFYNPITQNRNHIKHLSNLLEIPEDDFKSIIVFGNKSKIIKIEGYDDSCDFKVIGVSDVRNHIAINISKETEILSEYGVACLFDKLETYTDISNEAKERHKENIKEKLQVTN